MTSFVPTVILRHRKENLKKCSLKGLENRKDFLFFTYPQDLPKLPDLNHCIMLAVDADPLTKSCGYNELGEDCGLFVLDGTWKLCSKMQSVFLQTPYLKKRSLPSEYRTAYPRRQEDCLDPERGLASVEAIYVALHILGRSTEGLLDHYHWKDRFLEKNSSFF